jgi:2-polyprenyl-6-methoxyphenol hydroxylase-like FAD-dependent oxidoreductase
MLLARAAGECNAEIIFDAKLKEVDIGSVRAICKDGQNFGADVIIGADGMLLRFADVRKTRTKPHRSRLND